MQVRAFTEAEGPTGLNIQGSRVTSPRAFEIIKETLRGAGVKLVGPQEAEAAAKRGSPVVVDIRPAGDYSKGRIPGSVGVEFYRFITGEGAAAWAVVKKTAEHACPGLAARPLPSPDVYDAPASPGVCGQSSSWTRTRALKRARAVERRVGRVADCEAIRVLLLRDSGD